MIRIAIIAVVVLMLGAGGGYFLGKYLHPPTDVTPKEEAPPAKDDTPPKADLIYDIPDVIVELPGTGNNDRVLVMTISIVCPTQSDNDKLKEYLPRVLDAFQTYLRTLTPANFRGTKNLETVRSGLKERVNGAISPGQASAILIRQMTIR